MISPVLGYNTMHTMAHTMEKHRLAIPVTPRCARRTGFSHRVGVSQILVQGSGPSLCPAPMLMGLSYVHQDHEPIELVHKKHNTQRSGHPFAGALGLSGWGGADFHALVNFPFTEFSEVRLGAAR